MNGCKSCTTVLISALLLVLGVAFVEARADGLPARGIGDESIDSGAPTLALPLDPATAAGVADGLRGPFNGAPDYQTAAYGYYYILTGGHMDGRPGGLPNGDNAWGGTMRYILDDPAWGPYPLGDWQRDDWFPENVGVAVTMKNGGAIVYANNTIESGVDLFYNYSGWLSGDYNMPGLYNGYAMSNNFDWIYSGLFYLPVETTVDTIIGYFDPQHLSAYPFAYNDPAVSYRMNIWYVVQEGTSSHGVPYYMPALDSFDGNRYCSATAPPGTFATSMTAVSRVAPSWLSGGWSKPIWRLVHTLGAPLTLQPGFYCFSHDAVLNPMPTLTLNAAACNDVGGTVTVNIDMSGAPTEIVGGQFFLSYDTSKLSFVSAVPGTAPFTREIYEAVNAGAGTIDYAVGTPDGTGGTSVDTTMAVLTFTALTEICNTGSLITFRAHSPPTRLSDYTGGAVNPALNNLGPVTADSTVPTITPVTVNGGNVNGDCEYLVTFSATVDDNCCITTSGVTVAVALLTGNATLGTPSITKTQVDANTVSISGSVLVSDLTSCPATVQVTVNAEDCCDNPAVQAQASANVIDATSPVITCPSTAQIECDDPGAVLGWAVGGVLVVYNNNGPEIPANQAFFRAQFSQANPNGAVFNFNPGPTGYGPTHPFQVHPDQFGLDFTLPAPTYNGSNPPLVWFHAKDNVNGTCGGATDAGPVAWAISGYIPSPNVPTGCVVNSLFRSSGLYPGSVVLTQWSVTHVGTIFTAAVQGYLVSDGSIHWYTVGQPDTPMALFGLSSSFYFAGTLTYDSTGDPGNDGDFYAGPITVYTNSPLPTTTGVATATDNCDPAPDIAYTDVYTPGGCGHTGTITRTWTATDACGNVSTCTQTINVVDLTPPVFTYVPPGRSVNADAGTCAAVLNPPLAHATAVDNCDSAPVVTFVRSDGQPTLTAPYAAANSPITITWTARDCTNNTSIATTVITVSAFNEMVVNVQLQPTVVAGPFTRCITFELWDCPLGAPLATEPETLTFTGGSASATVLVQCGAYDCITARDELHTLRRTDEGFTTSGTQYVTDFTGDPSTGGDWLIGGNLNDDFWVDILDFGVYSWKYGKRYLDGVEVPTPPQNGNTTCSTGYPHADIDGDGLVGTADFTSIQINFLKGHEANCCGAPGFRGGEGEDGPITEITVAELQEMGLGHLAIGDLNGDGWLDQADIAAFLMGARPGLSEAGDPVPVDATGITEVGESAEQPAVPPRKR